MLFRHFILREQLWSRPPSLVSNLVVHFFATDTCKILASAHVLKVVQLGSSHPLLFFLYCNRAFLSSLNTGTSSRCSAGNSPARTHEEVNWCFLILNVGKWPEIPLLLPSFYHCCLPTVPFIPRSTPTFYTCSGINVLGADEAQIHLIHSSLNSLRGKKIPTFTWGSLPVCAKGILTLLYLTQLV